jgi:lysophospholipase L1-like esterase
VLNAAVDAYNAATARVTAATGAVLVDLHAAGLAARANGTEASLVSSDGFHPSDAGYSLVAKTFATAYARK